MHSLTEMLAEVAKQHQAELERLITTMQVCQDCRVAPIEVIYRPPRFEVALLGDDADEQLRGVGLPLGNPFVQTDMRVRITEVLRLLCVECSRRRAGL